MAELTVSEQENGDYVSSFARGLEVIRAFTRAKPSMTLSEVADRTDMNRAAARRFLLTLVREGYVETNGKHFRLHPKVLELGFTALSSMDICDVAQPVLNELSEKLSESCFVAVFDGTSAVYVARAASRRVMNVGINGGNRAGRARAAVRPHRARPRRILGQRQAREVHAPHRHLEGEAARHHRGDAPAGLVDRRPGAGGRLWSHLRAHPGSRRQHQGGIEHLLSVGTRDTRGHAHARADRAAGRRPAHLARASWLNFPPDRGLYLSS